MLDIDRRVKIEPLASKTSKARIIPSTCLGDPHGGQTAEEIDQDGDPDEGEARGVVELRGGDPEEATDGGD